MFTIKPETTEKTLVLQVSGKISKQDLLQLDPELHQRRNSPGPSHMVMILEDFAGYESLGALWTDLKMDIAHKDDFQKIAVIGGKRWQRGFSKVADLISGSEIKWFDNMDKAAAIDWVNS